MDNPDYTKIAEAVVTGSGGAVLGIYALRAMFSKLSSFLASNRAQTNDSNAHSGMLTLLREREEAAWAEVRKAQDINREAIQIQSTLRLENVTLKYENTQLSRDVQSLNDKVDRLEDQNKKHELARAICERETLTLSNEVAQLKDVVSGLQQNPNRMRNDNGSS